MSINYNDTGLNVNYLQYFLRDNYSDTTKMTWVYDEYTHGKLIEFLDTPNSIDSNELVNLINSIKFETENGDSNTTALEYPFKVMQSHAESDTIVYFLKNPSKVIGYVPIGTEDVRVLRFKMLIPVLATVYDEVKSLVETNGWKISVYPSLYYDVDTTSISEITINDIDSITVEFSVDTKTNLFPHFDMRYMINYFNNDYVNNYMIANNYFTKSSSYRVALVNCHPGDTFIISHGYSYSIPIAVGYCSDTMSDTITKFYTSTNSTSIKIRGIVENSIDKFIPSMPMLVNVPNTTSEIGADDYYQTLLILIPNLKYTKQSDIQTQTPLSFVDTNLIVGDLNNDGVIDEIDRLIYACQRPKDMGTDDVYYFTATYDRYALLCSCIEEKYETLFHTNVTGASQQYNNKAITYTVGDTVYYDIDRIVEHLKLLCSGSDITFTRYLVNGVISYKIKTGNNQTIKNMKALNDYSKSGFSVNDFDYYLSLKDAEESTAGNYLEKYIYDSDSELGYGLSDSKTSVGIRLVCNNNMTANNLLVIKTNPNDSIVDCSKIINGIHNSSDGTLTLPISEFKNNPWMVRDEFIPAVLDMVTSKYSNAEDINYVYKLLSKMNNDENVNFGDTDYIYSDELKKYIKKIQVNLESSFSLGYFDLTAYTEIYNNTYTNQVNRQNMVINNDYR